MCSTCEPSREEERSFGEQLARILMSREGVRIQKKRKSKGIINKQKID